MSHEFLDDRRRALEEAFFAQQTEAWRRQQREAAEAMTKREALEAASGITDTAVLDRLLALGLDGSSLAALSVVPLVLVAWADGSLDAKERAALLAAAAEAGVSPQGAGYQALTQWLTAPPSPVLLDAWTDYVRASAARLDAPARAALQAEILGRARRVAMAAGGFLGLVDPVSPAESAVLAKLEAAFKG
ncbi:hypothetical protein ACLF3G_04560 [Falsiroseomonas sp. HC035]|uniref:hypothetical protein n=1 Tax=Falsiroseomonas sp. HC035 TaxID=3390999 RepID=UPI003D321F23